MIVWGMIKLEIEEDDFDVVLSLAKVSSLNTSLSVMDDLLWEHIVTNPPIVEYNM